MLIEFNNSINNKCVFGLKLVIIKIINDLLFCIFKLENKCLNNKDIK